MSPPPIDRGRVGFWIIHVTQKGIPLLIIAGFGYLAESGVDGGFIKDIWTAAKTASPFAAMFAIMVWMDERKERRDAQKQCNDRTIDYIKSTNLAAAMFDRTVDKMLSLSPRSRTRKRRGGRR